MDEVILYRNQNCKCDARHKKMHENNPFLLLGPHQCKVVKYEMNCVQIFQRHTSEVIQAEFSYDGTMIASVDKKGVFIVWTIVNLGNSNLSENGDADEKGDSIQAENFFQESYMEHLCYPGEFHKVKDVKWSNDDNYIAIIFSNQIVLLEWRSKKRKAMILPISEGLSSVAWLNNSKNFVTSSLDEHMILWDIEGTKISVWETPMVEEICISRSETLIYASADTNIHVYDSKSKKFLYS
jgi:WD40 repeat protein